MPAAFPRTAGFRSSLMPVDVVTLFASGSADAVPLNRCPVVVGVPFARGACRDVRALGARRPDGSAIPIQARALDQWADGSVRWALVSLQVDIRAGGPVAEIGADLPPQDADPALQVIGSATEATVHAGRLRATLTTNDDGSRSIGTLSTAGGDTDLALIVTAHDGSQARVTIGHVSIEDQGPLRTVVRLDGAVQGDNTLLNLVVRLHFFAGHSSVRVDVLVRNPRAAVHRGGCWDLGDPGSVLVKGVSVVVTPRALPHAAIRCSPERDAPLDACAAPFLLHQDSSGGDNWRSTNHISRERQIARTFRGYRLLSGDDMFEGLRATPVVVAGEGDAAVSVAMEHFWENFPKAIASDGRGIELHLFPPQGRDLHEIQGGEQKTHTFYLAFGQDTISESPLDWVRRAPIVHVDPAYAASTRAVSYLSPDSEVAHPNRLALIRSAIEGADTVRSASARPSTNTAGGTSATCTPITRPCSRRARARSSRTTTISTTRSPGSRSSSSAAATAAGGRRCDELAAARRRHRHLPHRSRQGGLQRRAVLAYRSLHRRRYGDSPHLPASSEVTAAGRRTSTTTRPG